MTTEISLAIQRILGSDSARLVEAFYDPANRFAGATFDTLEPVKTNAFKASDVLATSLLDVPFLPQAVRRLLETERSEFEALLTVVPAEVNLWQAEDQQLHRLTNCGRRSGHLRVLDPPGPAS